MFVSLCIHLFIVYSFACVSFVCLSVYLFSLVCAMFACFFVSSKYIVCVCSLVRSYASDCSYICVRLCVCMHILVRQLE